MIWDILRVIKIIRAGSNCTEDFNSSWRGPLSYRNKSTDLQSKSVDWFLYDYGLHHERVNGEKLHLYSLKSKKDPFLTLCSLVLCCFQTIYFCNVHLFFRAMFLPLISPEVLTTKFDQLFKTQQALMDFLLLFLF